MSIVKVPSIASGFAPDAPPTTLRWFRNGIAPSAPGAGKLADRLNILMGQRMRMLHSWQANAGLNGLYFGNNADVDTVHQRGVWHTGPVTTKIGVVWTLLPTPDTLPVTGVPYAQLVLTGGLTGSGTTITMDKVYVPLIAHGNPVSLNDVVSVSQEVDVTPDNFYRAEFHYGHMVRPVACTVFELRQSTLDTQVTPLAVDPAPYYQGGPITDTSISSLITAADKVWKRGQPLFRWSTDYLANVKVINSATAANFSDGSTTPTATTAGYPINRQFSGSLDSSNIPVVMWAYAGMFGGGAGNIIFKDQNGNTIGTIPVTNTSNDWLAVRGNLTDASGGVQQTTKIDVYLQSDGVNDLHVYGFGMFMHDGADILTVSPLSWMPVRPRYVGYVDEVITLGR